MSWAGLCPRTIQSGARSRADSKPGNAYLRNYLGQAATGAARTSTFLSERYSRIARRRGKAKLKVAVGRSILVIIWHLLADPQPATTTWEPAGTNGIPTPSARSAATSVSFDRSGTP